MNLRLPSAGALVLLVVTAAAQSTDPMATSTSAAGNPADLAPAATNPDAANTAAAGASATSPATPAAPSEKRVVPNGRLPEAKRSPDRGKYGRIILPDVDLLDGSSFEKEKRPLRGMMSEIELGETDGGPQSKVSPESGPAGANKEPPKPDDPKTGGASAPQNVAQTPAAGGAAETPPPNGAQGGGGAEGQKIPEGQMAGGAGGQQPPNGQATPGGAGPASTAEGIQAASLKVPEGASGAVGSSTAKPQQMQIGDASLQIQSAAQNNSDVVGTQASTAQQYDRKTPAGGSSGQTSGGNVGVEKGRVVPKGL